MARRWPGVVMVVVLAAGIAAADGNEAAERLRKATTVLTAMASGGDAVIPRDLLAQARAVAVFPGVTKAAVIVGGRHGEGVVSARRADGFWSAPVFYEIGGGSFGLQVGAQVVDLVLLVMSQQGVESMLKSEFTLGGDASLAAGPTVCTRAWAPTGASRPRSSRTRNPAACSPASRSRAATWRPRVT